MLLQTLRSLVAAPALVLAGCNVLFGAEAALQPYYSPGSLAHDHGDARSATETIGCLDLAFRLADVDSRTVLEWRMGNRCNDGVATDLSRVAVVTRREQERKQARFVDPNGEIGPRDLAPRREAFERIAIRLDDERGKPDAICVDPSAVVAHSGDAPPPTCFAWNGAWYPIGRGGS
jgi:hypothetical protein